VVYIPALGELALVARQRQELKASWTSEVVLRAEVQVVPVLEEVELAIEALEATRLGGSGRFVAAAIDGPADGGEATPSPVGYAFAYGSGAAE
jgi:hypothetical protein